MSDFTLSAVVREDSGKGASRRLRRENGVPAIVYGGSEEPVTITIKSNEFNKRLENEAFYNSIITLEIAGKSEQVVLKDLQRHPAKDILWHADFLRVNKDSKIKAHVPLHFINEDTCVGVKMGGGKVTHQVTSIDIITTAENLPEFIQVDLADVEVGTVVHLSDLVMPEGVESLALSHGADYDAAVLSVLVPKGTTESDEDEAADAAE
ncbi:MULTISPECIES: 50S ribosomal protein L25/general stress protein Ctc [unclassified Oceanobacter]|jgi:large subunit ribosomal protein L25|uniref:50S ribosomal protein L25/general stress protein Ctc n=1 Tax=unclassified Oceanobacter TaxID=2620260 RepID=UPI0026E1CD51|nr:MULTISPECIES: 50S ribosomal protein L25/general stress protein Ctc [unclassified Oceanobacter]MDO6682241.1 50S ribosomal protein L25/general stress protein Ctc [Oceanobacter sp. 5_MG-2023]MDP2506326.1 50S ribosomal protein L25/general stress protein Ctc [Oceanobacter sp. 3_MG-2023]MDP2546413.1 50S ribosomal protein L25/general stress protein Ctc [Oceanobacter sp. 4_MG-2023]MDP2609986.1 50S ribosomal protein L25/general stress protein Ctc [Oceanobacter sp. 1_MG-2023]MDP2613256.1 50S ribosoma